MLVRECARRAFRVDSCVVESERVLVCWDSFMKCFVKVWSG